ncbi:MAG: SapC family protein [Litoreibacter sp.]
MVQRRAVTREDKEMQPDRLPSLYKTLIPLTADRHKSLHLSETRHYGFAETANAIPLSADEFPQAMRNYPIVFATGDLPTPVALVGYRANKNDFVSKGGSWLEGTYVPAYLRRYPFAYLKESDTSDRQILCADLSSTMFESKETPGRALFNEDNSPSKVLTNVMDFCNRYDIALQRTRAAMEEAKKLDLIEDSTVTIARNGQNIKVEGFNVISEDKLRKLPDDVLASLARRGVLNLFAAHHLSMTNFATFGT